MNNIAYIVGSKLSNHIPFIAFIVRPQQLLLFVTVFAAAESEKKEAIQKGRLPFFCCIIYTLVDLRAGEASLLLIFDSWFII